MVKKKFCLEKTNEKKLVKKKKKDSDSDSKSSKDSDDESGSDESDSEEEEKGSLPKFLPKKSCPQMKFLKKDRVLDFDGGSYMTAIASKSKQWGIKVLKTSYYIMLGITVNDKFNLNSSNYGGNQDFAFIYLNGCTYYGGDQKRNNNGFKSNSSIQYEVGHLFAFKYNKSKGLVEMFDNGLSMGCPFIVSKKEKNLWPAFDCASCSLEFVKPTFKVVKKKN